MTRRMIVPLLFGLIGIAILMSLGVWQLRRLDWKEEKIAQIDARMQSDPVELPADPNAADHLYLSVNLTGEVGPDEIHFLTSEKFKGPGYRVISRISHPNGSILVDLGFILQPEKDTARPSGVMRITGNLAWPNEFDESFTPEPDTDKNIWFARDVPAMASLLAARPVLLVARSVEVKTADGFSLHDDVLPLPVTSNITNDHFEYAVTWFSLAIVWFGMTVYLLWRIRRKTV